MPTIFSEKGFRFLFYSNEKHEPCHVHVIGRGGEMKLWIPSCDVARIYRLNSRDLADILAIAREKREEIERKWHEFFKSGK